MSAGAGKRKPRSLRGVATRLSARGKDVGMKGKATVWTVALAVLLSGCAAAFSELPADQRKETCAFLSHRALQGDFLACSLAAQRAAARQAEFSDAVAPRFFVTAEVVYAPDGLPVGLGRLDSDVPGEDSDSVTGCYRSALLSSAVPGSGRQMRVPIRFRFDRLGEKAPAAGIGREERGAEETFSGCEIDVFGEDR